MRNGRVETLTAARQLIIIIFHRPSSIHHMRDRTCDHGRELPAMRIDTFIISFGFKAACCGRHKSITVYIYFF